ncbi:hypothetical protein AALP_AA1G096300 [Arabis alpina]|uniref:IBH1-like N-terminal domain-containing protein n=1 Tax=Arabis alpina TaxID=50452 RepID=A0A087HM70_ARAAL|nr:hypothetical protein AALP_AA1G096300 [Arabis alpina]
MVDSDSLFPTIENRGHDEAESSRRKKRRISETRTTTKTEKSEIEARENLKRWKTNRVQQIYASKLFEALHRVRQRSNDVGKVNGTAREIRETADRVLAASARGTTRWSRAILASRTKRLKKQRKPKLTGDYKPRKATTGTKPVKVPVVERKLKILGRLIPGCKKVSVPNLLNEATDYIAALEMQVKAMEAVVELLATAAAPRSTTLTGP